MKRFYSILILAFVVHLFSLAQTELPYEKYLTEQFSYNLAPTNTYANFKTVLDNDKQNAYVFLAGNGAVTYNSEIIPAEGSTGLLLQISTSTGALIWYSTIGDATTNFGIETVVKQPNGNLTMYGSGYFQAGVAFKLGSQSFIFRTDMLPRGVFATFNPSTRLWNNVKFLYVVDNQGFSAVPKYDASGNFYLCGLLNASDMYIDNQLIASVGTTPGAVIYAYKENALGEMQYHKQTITLDNRTSINNPLFEVDNSGNLYIAGDISYIYGAISLDGIVVKNDTLTNAYDYSYDDIFLYKVNPTGTVEFGKIYLNSGNEAPRFLKALSNGTLCLSGEYSGKMNNFPPNSGYLNYNRFIANISSSTGDFNWAVPIATDVYYQDRYPFYTLTDSNDDIYFSVNFTPNKLNFMDQIFTKRNNKYGTYNTLVAKISAAGEFIWGRVLGPITSFETSYIDNPRVIYGMVGSKNLVLQVNNLSYGTNTNFAWGSDSIPTTTMSSGMWGVMAVVDKMTGNIVNGYSQKYTETMELDSVHFFAIRNNYSWNWDLTRFSPQSIEGIFTPTDDGDTMMIYPNPVRNELFIKNIVSAGQKVSIYSCEGKLIQESIVRSGKVSVKELPTGIFIVRVGDRFSRFIKID